MNDSRIDEVFARLEDMRIDLDEDPLSMGPAWLNNKVGLCRNYTNEAQKYQRECQRYIRQVSAQLRVAQAEYDLNRNDLLANDEDIIAMRNLSRVDREAAADYRLREDQAAINLLDNQLQDAKAVLLVIDDKCRELREVMSAIRLQRDLIKAEIETGNQWGDDISDKPVKHHKGDDVFPEPESLVEALSQENAKSETQTPFEVIEAQKKAARKKEEDDLDLAALFPESSNVPSGQAPDQSDRDTTTGEVDSSQDTLTFQGEDDTSDGGIAMRSRRTQVSTVPTSSIEPKRDDLDPEEELFRASQITDMDFAQVLRDLS